MTNLIIKELEMGKELDRSAMASVTGGGMFNTGRAVVHRAAAVVFQPLAAVATIVVDGAEKADADGVTPEPEKTGNSRDGLGFPWGSEPGI